MVIFQNPAQSLCPWHELPICTVAQLLWQTPTPTPRKTLLILIRIIVRENTYVDLVIQAHSFYKKIHHCTDEWTQRFSVNWISATQLSRKAAAVDDNELQLARADEQQLWLTSGGLKTNPPKTQKGHNTTFKFRWMTATETFQATGDGVAWQVTSGVLEV